jgi:hypothetical protein
MTVPSCQSSLWNNKARLARSRSDSKKTRHRCCMTRIGRQNKAFAYLNSSGAVNKKILLCSALLQHAFSCAVESKLTTMICRRMTREERETDRRFSPQVRLEVANKFKG